MRIYAGSKEMKYCTNADLYILDDKKERWQTCLPTVLTSKKYLYRERAKESRHRTFFL
jgi:hypothetical protein